MLEDGLPVSSAAVTGRHQFFEDEPDLPACATTFEPGDYLGKSPGGLRFVSSCVLGKVSKP
jgi:hypothetical protein